MPSLSGLCDARMGRLEMVDDFGDVAVLEDKHMCAACMRQKRRNRKAVRAQDAARAERQCR